MRNYARISAPPPEGIERKSAHIVGGGIAGLAAAVFLVDDAHMPADRITLYEALDVTGGALDGAGDQQTGYTARGDREQHESMECLWYLCGKIPSLESPGMTILDETYESNVQEPINAKFRLMANRGERYSAGEELMSDEDRRRMIKLWLTPEEKLENQTLADWFTPDFFSKSAFWYVWSSMYAFWPDHALIEGRRYLLRYSEINPANLHGILHYKYNQYDSVAKPIHVWLERHGVRFRTGTIVTDIETADKDGETLATGLKFRDADGEHRLGLTRDDLVFFTNGSLVQNSTHGDTNTVTKFDRNTADRGCFTVWEKMAARSPKFGKPEVFLSNVDRSGWISYYVTIKGDATFFDYMEAKTGNAPNTGGLTAIVDSPWRLNFALFSKTFPDQPDAVQTLQGYAQIMTEPGSYIKKLMPECTGAEIFAELLYHCGLDDDQIKSIVSHSIVHTYAMPYIVAEFMPRRVSDRPKVIPDGCVNLAFLGQFAEVPGEVVFTTECSVRSAMMAVYGLSGLKKPMIPLPESYFDVRVLALNLKIMGGKEELTPEDLRALPASEEIVSLISQVLNSAELP